MSNVSNPKFIIVGGGRSIDLTLSHRGLCALDRVGLAGKADCRGYTETTPR